MNLIVHHLRKDIRALRIPLAVWLVVMLAAALPDLFIFQPDYDAARAIDRFRDSAFTIVIAFIAWTLLIARLIQSEPVTGSTSFWLTRPIPRRVYLLSKLGFLALLVILPGFIPSAVQAYVFGLSAHDFQGELFGLLIFELIGALVVIWLATYTPNLMYFGGMLCVGLIGLVVLNVLIIDVRRNYGGAGSGVAVACGLFGLLASLVVEHIWRRGRAGLYTGLAAMTVGVIYWVLTPPSPGVASVNVSTSVGKTVLVDFQPNWRDTVEWSHTTFAGGLQVPSASASLRPAHEIPGAEIWVTNVSAQFNVPGSFSGSLMGFGGMAFYFGPAEKTSFGLVQALLPNIKLASSAYPTERGYSVGLFNLYGIESNVRDKVGTLTLEVKGQAVAPRQLAAIPLSDPHYVAHVPGGFIRVAPFVSADHPRSLSLWAVMPEDVPYSGQDHLFAVLVDPQNSSGKILQSQGRSSSSTSFTFSGARRISDTDLYYPLDGTEPLDRMVLYVFELEPTADFSTTLVAPNFKMTPVPQN